LLLFRTLLLNHPAPGEAAAAPPLPHAARAIALLSGDFVAALEDREAGVWRCAPRRTVDRTHTQDDGGGRAGSLTAPARADKRRAFRLVRDGCLGAPRAL